MTEPDYDKEYLTGIDHFNRHEFFEAHDAWESLWARTRGPDQLFYKGLIHAAVALHHFGNENFRGARKLLGSCTKYLQPYSPRHLGLDVAEFVAAMQSCFGRLADPAADPASAVALDRERVPNIELQRETDVDSPEES